ncbi:haloacid dehalogenase-like hydrolase domain containing 3 [Moniliophthora roreri MCA 2997]|uniref:Haloacid dehalogenase-like hydrolase domain containing 3 n=1 Tax=Moniliophthora roreri (strain MCA 2997) TaxID=1381753 RepID=V2XXA9_MONRO|nr:haloacid dehalogenase-like hydrolase domain containing 3 [Moniliophthora roreri MCA 2997]
MSPFRIRLVTFDVLHTLITPRDPIHVQYSMVFEPYLGKLPPDEVKKSFKIALKTLQVEKPVYEQGSQAWWGEVIRRTASGAGANIQALDTSLSDIVTSLMKRFSSREGYRAFDDAIPTIKRLHDLQVATAVVSNSDSRSRSVLQDLGFPEYLDPIVLSEEEGIEKPSEEIYRRVLEQVSRKKKLASQLEPTQCLHVGDELEADYYGARNTGMEALLLRRTGKDGEQAHVEDGEDLDGVRFWRGGISYEVEGT